MFDLPRAIAGAPIQTVGGYPMKFVAYRSDAAKRERLIVLDQMGEIQLYSDSGYHKTGLNPMQLCMGRGFQIIHMNLYRHSTLVTGQGWLTRELADARAGGSRIMCQEFKIPL